MPQNNAELTKSDFESLSEFRYQLRRFLRFSEEAAHSQGLTPQQYQLMLHVKGSPGRDHATIGELAQRLQTQQHGVVALVSRCEEAGWVSRSPGEADRRQVLVRLTADGDQRVKRAAELHKSELKSMSTVFMVANISAFNDEKDGLNTQY